MARRERIEFAKEFALCTVRPGYANTEYRFFSNVLTTHQQASVSLSQAWGEAGLAAIGRLDRASPNSVELPFPSKAQAQQIIVAHLDYFRIDQRTLGASSRSHETEWTPFWLGRRFTLVRPFPTPPR